MQFTHKSMTFNVGIDVDRNLIVASHIDPQKIKDHKDEETGVQIRNMSYADFFSVDLRISDICQKSGDNAKLHDDLTQKYWGTIVQNLCAKIDEKLAQ